MTCSLSYSTSEIAYFRAETPSMMQFSQRAVKSAVAVTLRLRLYAPFACRLNMRAKLCVCHDIADFRTLGDSVF